MDRGSPRLGLDLVEFGDMTMTITFSQYLAPIITDLWNVKAVIGRVEMQKCWGIVDCSMGMAKPAFTLNETEDYHQDDDNPELSDFN